MTACSVRGCSNPGQELHHWAPRCLFADADQWPQSLLCLDHHREWHRTTQTLYVCRNRHSPELTQDRIERVADALVADWWEQELYG